MTNYVFRKNRVCAVTTRTCLFICYYHNENNIKVVCVGNMDHHNNNIHTQYNYYRRGIYYIYSILQPIVGIILYTFGKETFVLGWYALRQTKPPANINKLTIITNKIENENFV